jgi:hypothetical protein
MALTVGSAIACSLYWYSSGIDATTISGRAAPDWYVWATRGIELIQKSCAALIPVILLRRWRYGEPLRPVDYLVILIGLSQFFLTIWQWPALGILSKNSPTSIHFSVNLEAFRVWKLSKLVAGIVVGLVVLIRRQRGPDWLSGVMIAFSWSCLTDSLTLAYQDWGNAMLPALSTRWPHGTIWLLSTILAQGPIRVLAYIPFAIMLMDLFRSPGRQRLWVEVVSIVLVLLLPIGFQGRYIAHQVLTSGFNGALAMDLGGWVASIALACLLARIFEPVWRRILEGSPVNSSMS